MVSPLLSIMKYVAITLQSGWNQTNTEDGTSRGPNTWQSHELAKMKRIYNTYKIKTGVVTNFKDDEETS